MSEAKTRIAVLVGSAQEGANSLKAAKVVIDELGKHEGVAIDLIDPREWKLGVPGLAPEGDESDRLRKLVGAADGAVLVTPEYHGSYSSTMKLLLDNLGFPSVLEGKPVVTVGVAAGRIGAIKAMEHLRSVASHIGMIVLPGPISIAGAFQAFHDDGTFKDEGTDDAVRGVPRGLLAYLR